MGWGLLVCLLRSPAYPDGVKPGGDPSVIQDGLDKTGHVCFFGFMQGEKWMFH